MPRLYTGKGDDGTTSLFGCPDRLSKSAAAIEALGALDELNAVLGWAKAEASESGFSFSADREGERRELTLKGVLGRLQQDLFVAQAELAGADKRLSSNRTAWLEFLIENAARHLPEIKNFIVPGGTQLSAILEVARTAARRAERRVVEAREEGKVQLSDAMPGYLNRLSSVLFALARLANAKAGVEEERPEY